MASKLSLALVFFCLLQVCLSARMPRDATTTKKDSSSSEELTSEDINKIQVELSKTIPPKDAERFVNVLRKFTKDATSAENLEGVTELFALALASHSNKTEEEWKKILTDNSEEKEQEKTEINAIKT